MLLNPYKILWGFYSYSYEDFYSSFTDGKTEVGTAEANVYGSQLAPSGILSGDSQTQGPVCFTTSLKASVLCPVNILKLSALLKYLHYDLPGLCVWSSQLAYLFISSFSKCLNPKGSCRAFTRHLPQTAGIGDPLEPHIVQRWSFVVAPGDTEILCLLCFVYPWPHPAHSGGRGSCWHGSLRALATGFQVIALMLPWAAYF